MFMAEERGLPAVLETLQRLRDTHGLAFEPAPLIADRVAAGKHRFDD